jgi:hypothetical protein
MSEEQKEENVGSSLVSALFEAAEKPQEQEQEQTPEAPEEMSVYGLSDAIDMSQEPAVEKPAEVAEQGEVEEDKDEALSKLDKSLFEEIEPQEPEAQPEPEPLVEEEPGKQEEDLNWLTEDQRKRLELVSFAEGNFDEYKGKKAEYIEFFKAQKDYLDSRLADDPNALLDETDHDYQAFLKRKKPKFDQDDLERVVELRTRQLAKQEALDELKPQLDEIKSEQRRQQILPAVEKLKKTTLDQVKTMIPDAMREVIEKEGPQAAYDKNPAEFEIVNRIVTAHQKAMFAFHEISQGLSPYDPANRDHVRLASYIDQLEASMPDRDGKKYVSITRYPDLDPKERAKSYTLSADEIVEQANSSAQKFINQELNAFEEKLRKSGFVRTGQSPVQQQVAPAPRPVKPQPRQGASVQRAQSESSERNPVMSALGF